MSIDEVNDKTESVINRVTVYRVINCFAENGIIEKVHHNSNLVKVVLSPEHKDSHEHIVTCRICGDSYTTHICVEPGWKKNLERLGFKNVSHNLSFNGICSNH